MGVVWGGGRAGAGEDGCTLPCVLGGRGASLFHFVTFCVPRPPAPYSSVPVTVLSSTLFQQAVLGKLASITTLWW